jgi:hypothetical protein
MSLVALMAGGGGQLGGSGARGKKEGEGFIGAVRRFRLTVVAYRDSSRGGGDVRRCRRPMEKGGSPAGECAPAAWHRPRPPRKRHGL